MEQSGRLGELLEMCYYGHIDQVKKLISEGMDVNTIGRGGMTPLMAARDGNNKDIIDFLLSIGAKDL